MNLVNKFHAEQADLPVGLLGSRYNLRARLYIKLLIIDALVIGLSFAGMDMFSDSAGQSVSIINIVAMVVPIYLGVSINGNAYSLQALSKPTRSAVKAVIFLLFSMLAVQSVLYFAHASGLVSRLSLGGGVFLSAIILASVRRPFSRYALKRSGGRLTSEVFIRDGVDIDFPTGDNAPIAIDASSHDLQPDLNDPWMLHRLGGWLRMFDRVVIACPPGRRHAWSILLRGVSVQGEIIIPEAMTSGAIGIGSFEGRETHLVAKGALDMPNRIKKRMFDLALTLPALLFLAPLMAMVAIAIKLESKGPVFFLQDRIGQGNRLFKITKFRSMYVENSDFSGAASTGRSDSRVTRVGHIIRKTSIDELPQLFNVLLGQMSIVGPRPHALGSTAEAKLFWQISEYYWCRHALKPGITGLAQIRGYRGATEKSADLENRLSADLEYLQDWSLTREISILVRTFNVLTHANAF